MAGDVFDIVFTTPVGYVPGISTLIPPTPGPLSATGLPDPFQVQPQSGAPQIEFRGAETEVWHCNHALARPQRRQYDPEGVWQRRQR